MTDVLERTCTWLHPLEVFLSPHRQKLITHLRHTSHRRQRRQMLEGWDMNAPSAHLHPKSDVRLSQARHSAIHPVKGKTRSADAPAKGNTRGIQVGRQTVVKDQLHHQPHS